MNTAEHFVSERRHISRPIIQTNSKLIARKVMEQLQCNCSSLRSAGRALSAAYDEVLKPCGLKMTQFSILARVGAVGQIRLSELAGLLAMDRTTLGRNLLPLVRDSLVKIEVGEDRRERWIDLTAKGRRTLTHARPLWDSVHARFEKKFGVRQASAMRAMMKQIVQVGRELAEENALS
jgi:DNA-binding MarR family transcriptional regulator